MIYLAPDLAAGGMAPSGPNFGMAQAIGSVIDTDLSIDYANPTLVSFSVPYPLAQTVLSGTTDSAFRVILESGTSNIVWSNNDGAPAGIGADTQAIYNSNDGVGSTLQGALLMQVETPEPLSIAILGVGLAGLGVARRRARKH